MTHLPTVVAGRWFYLYLILDLYSRKIVGFEVHDHDDADHAALRVKRAALAEGIHAMASRTARRSRRHTPGHDRVGDTALAGDQTVVLVSFPRNFVFQR